MGNFDGTSVNWQVLERVDFKVLSDIGQWGKMGDNKAQNTGLMVLQSMHEVRGFLEATFGNDGYGRARARRATRPIQKIANHLTGIRDEFRKLPDSVRHVYEREILAANRKSNSGKYKPLDLTK